MPASRQALHRLLLAALMLVHTSCGKDRSSLTPQLLATGNKTSEPGNELRDTKENQEIRKRSKAEIEEWLTASRGEPHDLHLNKPKREQHKSDVFFLHNRLNKEQPEEAKEILERHLGSSSKTEDLIKARDELLDKVYGDSKRKRFIKKNLARFEGNFFQRTMAKWNTSYFSNAFRVDNSLAEGAEHIAYIEKKFHLKEEENFVNFFEIQFVQPLRRFYNFEDKLEGQKKRLAELKKDLEGQKKKLEGQKKDNVSTKKVQKEEIQELESQIRRDKKKIKKLKSEISGDEDILKNTANFFVNYSTDHGKTDNRLKAVWDTRLMREEWEAKQNRYLELVKQHEQLKVDFFAVFNSRIPNKEEKEIDYKVQLPKSEKLENELRALKKEIKKLRKNGKKKLFTLRQKK